MEYFLFGFAEAHRLVLKLRSLEEKMNELIDSEIELKRQSEEVYQDLTDVSRVPPNQRM